MYDYEINEVCAQFRFNHAQFRQFLEEYSVIPLAELPPLPDEPVELSFDKICQKVDLPKHVVRKIQKEGVISYPITTADLDALVVLGKIYGRSWLVKSMLTKFNKEDRRRLITRPELNKWESWAYTRWINNEIEYGTGERMLTPERRVNIDWMMIQIEEIFGVPKCENTKQRLLKIRKMASNDKQAAKKKGLSLEDMARKRNVGSNSSSQDEERYSILPWEGT